MSLLTLPSQAGDIGVPKEYLRLDHSNSVLIMSNNFNLATDRTVTLRSQGSRTGSEAPWEVPTSICLAFPHKEEDVSRSSSDSQRLKRRRVNRPRNA